MDKQQTTHDAPTGLDIDLWIKEIRELRRSDELDLLALMDDDIRSCANLFVILNTDRLNSEGVTADYVYHIAREMALTMLFTDKAIFLRYLMRGDRQEHIVSRFTALAPYLVGKRNTQNSKGLEHHILVSNRKLGRCIRHNISLGYDSTSAILNALEEPGARSYTPGFNKLKADAMLGRVWLLRKFHPEYDTSKLEDLVEQLARRAANQTSNPVVQMFGGKSCLLYRRLTDWLGFLELEERGRSRDDIYREQRTSEMTIDRDPGGVLTNDFIDIADQHPGFDWTGHNEEQEDKVSFFLKYWGKPFFESLDNNTREFAKHILLNRNDIEETKAALGLSQATYYRRRNGLAKAMKQFLKDNDIKWNEMYDYSEPVDEYKELVSEAKTQLKQFKHTGAFCEECEMWIHVNDIDEFNRCPVCRGDLI